MTRCPFFSPFADNVRGEIDLKIFQKTTPYLNMIYFLPTRNASIFLGTSKLGTSYDHSMTASTTDTCSWPSVFAAWKKKKP